MKQVVVYLLKRERPLLEMEPEWATLEAIRHLERCARVPSSARRVPSDRLDADGFLPYGLTPDDLDA